MVQPQFNLTFVEDLVNHRTPFITEFFDAVTSLGRFDIYILIMILIYVTWNKRLAIRLAVLLILTITLNGVLKLIIRNPRPFVHEGTYFEKWAVTEENAKELAADFSTPSGHAMTAAGFYSYLVASTRNWYLRILFVVVILLIGASRPYLGVHYLEDVLLGWAIGLACALAFLRYSTLLGTVWGRLSFSSQVGIAVGSSLVLWVLAIALNEGPSGNKAAEILSNNGFLTGIVIAHPLEQRIVNFDPRSSSLKAKILRFFFTSFLVFYTEAVLRIAFGYISGQDTMLGFVSHYLRFAAAGFVCIFLAPFLFTKLGLARTMPPPAV